METKFQTSFIPKKPLPISAAGISSSSSNMVRRSSGGNRSIFMVLATIIFVASIFGVGGAYAWKAYLVSQQQDYKDQLNLRKEQFKLDRITFLKVQGAKIDLARSLIVNHGLSSKIFSFVSLLTAESVRFTSMNITSPTGAGGPLVLNLIGYGRDLTTVAFQASVLNKLQDLGLNATIKNPIISNPTLNQDGTVSFALTANIEPSSLLKSNVPAAVPTGQTTNP